jgi:hypothetical protein
MKYVYANVMGAEDDVSINIFHQDADTIPRRLEPLPKLYTCL